MQLQQNIDRIQTAHIGGLPRPRTLLNAMKAKYSGQNYDASAHEKTLPTPSLTWCSRGAAVAKPACVPSELRRGSLRLLRPR